MGAKVEWSKTKIRDNLIDRKKKAYGFAAQVGYNSAAFVTIMERIRKSQEQQYRWWTLVSFFGNATNLLFVQEKCRFNKWKKKKPETDDY